VWPPLPGARARPVGGAGRGPQSGRPAAVGPRDGAGGGAGRAGSPGGPRNGARSTAQRRRLARNAGHRPGCGPAHHRAGVRRPGGGGGDLASDPPARLAGPKGGVDTPVRTAVPGQARPAAGRRAGARVRARPGWARACAAGVAGGCPHAGGQHQGSRRHRRIIAHVGLPDGYCGATGPLLAALGVRLDGLREAVAAELGGVRP
jgi:hypothetical protein